MDVRAWQAVFREGVAPLLGQDNLEVLAEGLRARDPAILRGRTSLPDMLDSNHSEALTAVDPILYPAFKRQTIKTVGEADELLAALSYEIDLRMGEPGALRHFFNWWDGEDHEKAEASTVALLEEVTRALSPLRRKRGGVPA